MGELRGCIAGGLEDENVLEGVRKMILAADNMADAQVGIIGAGSEMIGRHAVGAKKGEVLDVGGRLRLLPVNCIAEAHHLAGIAGNAKAHREGFTGGGAAITLLAREFEHVSVKEPCPLRSGFLAIAGVGRSEVAVGQSFLKDSVGHGAVQSSAFGLFVLLVPIKS